MGKGSPKQQNQPCGVGQERFASLDQHWMVLPSKFSPGCYSAWFSQQICLSVNLSDLLFTTWKALGEALRRIWTLRRCLYLHSVYWVLSWNILRGKRENVNNNVGTEAGEETCKDETLRLWIQILPLPLPRCARLYRLRHLSEAQFPVYETGVIKDPFQDHGRN